MAREITGDEDAPAGSKEARPEKKRRKRGGVSLLVFFNLLVYSFTAGALALVYFPREDAPETSGAGMDVREVIRNADAEALSEVVLTEEGLNDFLGRTLRAVDSGPVADWVTHGRAWVRFHEGKVEVFLEREVFGKVSSLTLEIELEETGQARILTVTGGRFGRLPMPRGALKLVLPAYASLKDAYPEEIAAVLSAKKITFVSGKMILSL